MAKKYKLTGFARLLIFFVIVTPIVYLGVNYFKGEDPMASINKIELPSIKKKKTNSGNVSEDNIIKESLKLKDQRIKDLEKRIRELELQNDQLSNELRRTRARK